MSRRNAQARAPAASTRARRRLTASLGAASEACGQPPPGLLEQGSGGPDSEPFTYDGGAHPAPGSVEGSDGAGMPGPAKFRWRTGLRVAVVLGILSLLLGGWFWWDIVLSRPHVMPLSGISSPAENGQPEGNTAGAPAATRAPPGAGEGPDAASGSGAGAKIVVHVAGAVNKAGIVEVPPGSRIHEAIAAAGGSSPGADLNRLNLAAVLTDGQKIHVPLIGDPADAAGTAASETGSGGGGSGNGSGEPGSAGAKIDLNSASAEELGALPRVGPVLAQRIVDWRKEHGRFSSVEELDAVDGVGPKMLETLLPLVRIS